MSTPYSTPGANGSRGLRQAAANALAPAFNDLLTNIGAGQAVLLSRMRTHDEPWQVVATAGMSGAFQPQEPVRVTRSAGAHGVRSRVELHSMMFGHSLRLDEAIVLSEAEDQMEGMLIIGAPTELNATAAEPSDQDVRELMSLYHQWRAEVESMRHRDVDRAYRIIAEATASPLSAPHLVDLVLSSARRLMDSDVAYLAVPGIDDHFVFSRTLGVRTGRFRSLRVGPHEGLGGTVRSCGSPVFVGDYQSDPRVGEKLRNVTKHEGIYSALATPVRDRGEIEALLYVGSRSPMAYTQVDASLLEEFSHAAHLTLQHEELDDHRRAVIREEERRQLGLRLHDRLGRELTRIAFAAEDLRDNGGEPLGHQLNDISAAIAECQALLRTQLDSLLDHDRPSHRPARAVARDIDRVPALTDMRRRFQFASDDVGDRMISADLAETMVSVGQELLFNSERHSGGTQCIITISHRTGGSSAQSAHIWLLTVEDDGRGEPTSHHSGHGLRFVTAAVRNHRGSVQTEDVPGGGLRVRCVFEEAVNDDPA